MHYWGQRSCRGQSESTRGQFTLKCHMATKFGRENPRPEYNTLLGSKIDVYVLSMVYLKCCGPLWLQKIITLPAAPPPPGAHFDLLSPRFARYALTFLNWSSAPSTSKKGSAGPARIFQQQFLKRNMSDLFQS